MRPIRSFLALLLVAAAAPSGALAWPSPHTLGAIAYVSPAPGSVLHRPGTNVIVRHGGLIDSTSLVNGVTIRVTGSTSGSHDGSLRLSDDGRTVLFRPTLDFVAGEVVTCVIEPGLRTIEGQGLPGATFTFAIAPATPPPSESALASLREELRGFVPTRSPAFVETRARRAGLLDSLPDDWPTVATQTYGATGAGAVFLSDLRFDDLTYRSFLMILGPDGAPIAHRRLWGSGFDFKVHPNGRVTYFDAIAAAFFVMNAKLAVLDSLRCGNGYITDLHELQLLDDGHALLMAYDPEPFDMSAVVSGGNPAAEVVGLVIQELDRAKDVVFQWRSWDHFRIQDVTSRSLTDARIDYAHGNGIERDADGHLLVSSRHMDEITKISRETGEILWRLGGKNNEFTFVNDPERFSQQHSVRRLSNGHLLLFDNGSFHAPPYSRAVEYALDETNKTAALVWSYRNRPDTFGFAMGSVQRLPNGNTFIGWGAANPTATEVAPSGAKVAEIELPPAIFSYRAFRHEWPPVLSAEPVIRPGSIDAARRGGQVTIAIASGAFPADSIIAASVRLAGIEPEEPMATPAAGRSQVELRFSTDRLLALLPPGRQRIEVTGSLAGGERFRGAVDVEILGRRRERARVLSAVAALPVRIQLREDGTSPRTVRLAAYDIRGRRVDRWEARSDAAGVISWNGRAAGGGRLAAGVYFLTTEGTALEELARVVLVR